MSLSLVNTRNLAITLMLAALIVVSPLLTRLGDAIPATPHSSPSHVVTDPAAIARIGAALTALTAARTTTGGPNDPNAGKTVVCLLMKASGVPVRAIIWVATRTSCAGNCYGDLSWYDGNGWGGSYSDKSFNTLNKVPGDLDKEIYTMESVACDQLPPPPGLPQ